MSHGPIVHCPICQARCRRRTTRTGKKFLMEIDDNDLFARLHLISMCMEGLLQPLPKPERRLAVVR